MLILKHNTSDTLFPRKQKQIVIIIQKPNPPSLRFL